MGDLGGVMPTFILKGMYAQCPECDHVMKNFDGYVACINSRCSFCRVKFAVPSIELERLDDALSLPKPVEARYVDTVPDDLMAPIGRYEVE